MLTLWSIWKWKLPWPLARRMAYTQAFVFCRHHNKQQRLAETNLFFPRQKCAFLNHAYATLKLTKEQSAFIPQKRADMPLHSSLTCAKLEPWRESLIVQHYVCKWRLSTKSAKTTSMPRMITVFLQTLLTWSTDAGADLITFFYRFTRNLLRPLRWCYRCAKEEKHLCITCKITRLAPRSITSKKPVLRTQWQHGNTWTDTWRS